MATDAAGDGAGADDELDVGLELTDEQAVIRVVGDVDVSNSERLHEVVAQAIHHGSSSLVFDLAGVEFMDSSAIAALLTGAAQVERTVVRNPSVAARRVIEATGLTSVLPEEP